MFCQSQAFSIEEQPENFQKRFSNKAKRVNKSQNLKIWLQKSQIGHPDERHAAGIADTQGWQFETCWTIHKNWECA